MQDAAMDGPLIEPYAIAGAVVEVNVVAGHVNVAERRPKAVGGATKGHVLDKTTGDDHLRLCTAETAHAGQEHGFGQHVDGEPWHHAARRRSLHHLSRNA